PPRPRLRPTSGGSEPAPEAQSARAPPARRASRLRPRRRAAMTARIGEGPGTPWALQDKGPNYIGTATNVTRTRNAPRLGGPVSSGHFRRLPKLRQLRPTGKPGRLGPRQPVCPVRPGAGPDRRDRTSAGPVVHGERPRGAG